MTTPSVELDGKPAFVDFDGQGGRPLLEGPRLISAVSWTMHCGRYPIRAIAGLIYVKCIHPDGSFDYLVNDMHRHGSGIHYWDPPYRMAKGDVIRVEYGGMRGTEFVLSADETHARFMQVQCQDCSAQHDIQVRWLEDSKEPHGA